MIIIHVVAVVGTAVTVVTVLTVGVVAVVGFSVVNVVGIPVLSTRHPYASTLVYVIQRKTVISITTTVIRTNNGTMKIIPEVAAVGTSVKEQTELSYAEFGALCDSLTRRRLRRILNVLCRRNFRVACTQSMYTNATSCIAAHHTDKFGEVLQQIVGLISSRVWCAIVSLHHSRTCKTK